MVKLVSKLFKDEIAQKNIHCDNCINVILKGKTYKSYHEKTISSKLCIFCHQSLKLKSSVIDIERIRKELEKQ